MDPASIAKPGPTRREIELELTVRRLEGALDERSGDLRSAKEIASVQNSKLIRLEAENVRLKMQRTDKELSTQVDGLRHEVSRKDRELVEIRRELEKRRAEWYDAEKIILLRASSAEERVSTFQKTMETMQRDRQAKDQTIVRDLEEIAALKTKLIDYSDRTRRAEEALAKLQKTTSSGKPPTKK